MSYHNMPNDEGNGGGISKETVLLHQRGVFQDNLVLSTEFKSSKVNVSSITPLLEHMMKG